MFLTLDLSGVFLLISLGIYFVFFNFCLEEEETRAEESFLSRYQDHTLPTRLIPAENNSDHLAKTVFIMSVPCKSFTYIGIDSRMFILYCRLQSNRTFIFMLKLFHLWPLGVLAVGSHICDLLHPCVWFLFGWFGTSLLFTTISIPGFSCVFPAWTGAISPRIPVIFITECY